ncbi:unnamed protein product [Caenorhabditis bovis]|uniref:Uncharacterized protein n=1 Tax=Caenorhabditis bovis TaxID=2654633 RepID=A0A8S1EDL1_9PELO|nr:unnamed protein product [Caenorhabditis bovis]
MHIEFGDTLQDRSSAAESNIQNSVPSSTKSIITNPSLKHEGTKLRKSTSMGNNLLITVQSVTNMALENMGIEKKLDGPIWPAPFEGLMSTLSFIITSGNIWFFPSICAYYGGWFIYQFTFCFIFIGVPLVYLEMALGQFASASPLSVFSRMVPSMAGLSAAMSFLLVFRCICVAVWTVFDMVIVTYSASAFWANVPWQNCQPHHLFCVDYKQEHCRWKPANYSRICDAYHRSVIDTRGILVRKSPFISYVFDELFIDENVNILQMPSLHPIICTVLLWVAATIVAIGGSKIIGKTAGGTLALFVCCFTTLFFTGITFDDSKIILKTFLNTNHDYSNNWMWMWSWADAASHSLRALNVGCGGIQKMASLNRFHHKFQRDVILVSIFAYTFYIVLTLSSFMFMAEFGSFYYPSESYSLRIQTYASPVVIESAVSEVYSRYRLGGIFVFFFWFSMVLCGIQGLASYLWILSSMLIERINGSQRKYGRPLTSWQKRAIIVSGMSLGGLISSVPFLGIGGFDLMSSVETYASYGTLLVAFIEIVTVAYIYGFRRFWVNIRTMTGSKGIFNIYWWLNWVLVSPLILIAIYTLILIRFHQRSEFFSIRAAGVEILGWTLVLISIVFVLFYFIRDLIETRLNKEPLSALFRATGDWGPANFENRKESVRQERALRVRC